MVHQNERVRIRNTETRASFEVIMTYEDFAASAAVTDSYDWETDLLGDQLPINAVYRGFWAEVLTPFAGGKGVATSSVAAGGTYIPDGVGLAATQASTSGSGTGATFTVTVAGNTVATVDSIVTPGSGYAATDTITLTIAGQQGDDAAVINVDTITAAATLTMVAGDAGVVNEVATAVDLVAAAQTITYRDGALAEGTFDAARYVALIAPTGSVDLDTFYAGRVRLTFSYDVLHAEGS